MSGIEIAGVILGVIPLLIAAAEQIKGSRESRKAIRTSVHAGPYKTKLTQQQTLLRLYLKEIVARTSLSADEQAELITEPSGDSWAQPHVVKAISEELGEAYDPFVDLLSRLCAVLALCVKADGRAKDSEKDFLKLLKRLSLESQQETKPSKKQAGLVDRFKQQLGSSGCEARLEEIEECNAMIEKLSKAAFAAKLYEKSQETRQAHAAFRQKEDANRLYQVLRNACRCQNAGTSREVALRLQVPTRDDDGRLESRFHMMVLDTESALCAVSARIVRAADPGPPRKKTRFSEGLPETTSALERRSMKALVEICDEVKRAAANKVGFEIYVDSKEDVYTRQDRATSSHSDSSLELLDLSSVMSSLSLDKDKKWVHREKSILAVILGYSLMRLHESPWLSSPLTSDSISFLNDWQSTAHDTDRVKLRRPFTRSQVSAAATGPRVSCCPQYKTLLPHRNAHLHALGVILLELYLNRSLEPDVQRRIDERGSADYRSVAIAVLEEYSTDMNMTPFYNRAICFCLSPRPSPENRTFSFEDQGFREIFHTEVITNLEENLRARFEVEKDFFD